MAAQLPAKGFTLVELVVIILVVGILAAIAVPRFASQQGFQSRVFFDQVQEAIKFAQKAAIAERKRVFVTVGATSIQACYTAACGGGGIPVTDPTTGGALALVAQDARGVAFAAVTLAASTTPFVFDGLGRPRDGAGTLLAGVTTINVNSTSPGDVNRAILIEPETGYVHQ